MESQKPSIEEFFKRCSEGKLYLTRCGSCSTTYGSPRSTCVKCGFKGVTWIPSKGIGELTTWTIIHVATPEFQDKTPYIVGIVKLEEGGKLLSTIKDVKPQELKQGMKLKINFETHEKKEWPNWPKYYFEPYT